MHGPLSFQLLVRLSNLSHVGFRTPSAQNGSLQQDFESPNTTTERGSRPVTFERYASSVGVLHRLDRSERERKKGPLGKSEVSKISI